MARKKTGPKTAEGKRRSRAALEKHKWKKGQSGNPKGRPPGKPVSSHLKGLLDEPASKVPYLAKIIREVMQLEPEAFTVGEALAYSILGDALAGDSKKIEIALERAEGKVMQRIQQTVDGQMSISDAMAAVNRTKGDDED